MHAVSTFESFSVGVLGLHVTFEIVMGEKAIPTSGTLKNIRYNINLGAGLRLQSSWPPVPCFPGQGSLLEEHGACGVQV